MGTYGSTWEAGGYSGAGLVGSLIGSLQGRTAIVCGSGEMVFYELSDAMTKEPDSVIFAANDVGMYLPRLDHWCSLHTDNLGPWKNVRWLHARGSEDTQYHGIDQRPFINHVWQGLTPLFALSGYFAMQIAHIMGAERIILCGCPGDHSLRFFEAAPRPDFGYGGGPAGSDKSIREQLVKEMSRLPAFKEKVRSMGGWTQEFFSGL